MTRQGTETESRTWSGKCPGRDTYGFTMVPIGPDEEGDLRDTAIYSILKDDWPLVRQQLVDRLELAAT